MLDSPDIMNAALRIGAVSCFAFGTFFSVPSIWLRFFPVDDHGNPIPGGPYLKTGEYGESELTRHSWMALKEPLNAWSSLFYSFFGVVITVVGCYDLLSSISGEEIPHNSIMRDSTFSITFGSFSIYLGISSFLFHASHTETWRKVDAALTSGIVLPVLLFGIWDRSRPPYISSTMMIVFCNVLLLSLSSGYVPYGMSDVLLPSLILCTWLLELSPYFGGVVSDYQYTYWLICLYCIIGGVLLRATDIKRKSLLMKTILVSVFFLITAVFTVFVDLPSIISIMGLIAGIVTLYEPYRGHVFWHIFSSYALFIWWYMLRLRPGDPSFAAVEDSVLLVYNIPTVLLMIAVRNGVRRILMLVSDAIVPVAYRDAIRRLCEHILFAVWGYDCIVRRPSMAHSWFVHPLLNWYTPVYPSESFECYYLAQTACYLEDALFLLVTGSTKSKEGSESKETDAYGNPVPSRAKRSIPSLTTDFESANSEKLRAVHHVVSCILATSSLFTGKLRARWYVFMLSVGYICI